MRVTLLMVFTAACIGPQPPPHAEVDAGAEGFDAGTLIDAGTFIDAGITTAQRIAAAAATATDNALCVDIKPFYWELGDKDGALVSGSLMAARSNKTYGADTKMPIASASKWVYSTYFVQKTGGVLSAEDIKFMNFWSGYTNFGACDTTATVASCLDEPSRGGKTNGTFDPTTEDTFSYGGGHMQKHAALNGLGSLDNTALAAEVRSQLGADLDFTYGSPQLAGGMNTSASEYAKMLRKIIAGELVMHDVLGTHPVCADPTTCALAQLSPSPPGEQFHYSIGHWLEDDPVVGDGAFSSAGAFGFYPWVDATKSLYGIIARTGGGGGGMDSLRCGRRIRKAWVTGTAEL